MSGIYVHIPFCKKKCSYCDFYSTTAAEKASLLIDAILDEIQQRKSYIHDNNVETIYFGGGTPSLLQPSDIKRVIDAVYSNFAVSQNPEITMEANPDDLSESYLKEILKTGVNRLSIGLQSFDDNILRQMNRRHSSIQSENAVKTAQNIGFNNISIDLIYGWPGLTNEAWIKEIERALKLDIQHISSYHITYHENTVLYNRLIKKEIREADEDESVKQYNTLVDMLSSGGIPQYEISNFARSGFRSKHNSSYWEQKEYLGLGPSAHSYNINTRYWNIANTKKYMDNVGARLSYGDTETLSINDNFNDMVIVRLRTVEGINKDYVKRVFGIQYLNQLLLNSRKHIELGLMDESNDNMKLTRKGMFLSDGVIEDLMIL